MATYENFTEYFDSVSEFERACNTRPVNPVFEGKEDSKKVSKGKTKFTGTQSYDEATYFLRCGDWDKMGGLMKADGNPGFDMVSDKVTPKMRHREYGGAVNVARYIQGNPQCMRRTERVHVQDNIINIAYEFNMLGKESVETLVSNGKKVASLIKSLENIGYRVSLYCISCSYCNGQYLTSIVKIKDSGQPLSLLALTYPVCNASFWRRHTFRWYETAPCELEKSWRYGYGFSEYNADKIKPLLNGHIRSFRLLTSSDLKKCSDVQDLVKLFNNARG